MAWPSSTNTNTGCDSAGAPLTDGRVAIKQMADDINSIIDEFQIADNTLGQTIVYDGTKWVPATQGPQGDIVANPWPHVIPIFNLFSGVGVDNFQDFQSILVAAGTRLTFKQYKFLIYYDVSTRHDPASGNATIDINNYTDSTNITSLNTATYARSTGFFTVDASAGDVEIEFLSSGGTPTGQMKAYRYE